MKKNILIIGYGDIGRRLRAHCNQDINIYALSRGIVKEEGVNHFSWDWLLSEPFPIKDINFDFVIVIPKPSEMSESGYVDGFLTSIKNINDALKFITYNNIIAISSTRVFGEDQTGNLTEDIEPIPGDFRGKIIKDYESSLRDCYKAKLTILRFSGLYSDTSKKHSFNRLNRNSAVKIIDFLINKPTPIIETKNNIIHCSEDITMDSSKRCISNIKLKELGFSFDF